MNIKNNIYGVFFLGMVMASLSLSSCAGDEELSSSLDASKDKIVSPADVTFGGNATSATFSIQASGLWSISGKPDWFNLDKTQGTGDATIKLTTIDNENPSALNKRTATLELNTDTRQRTITMMSVFLVQKPSWSNPLWLRIIPHGRSWKHRIGTRFPRCQAVVISMNRPQ